MFVPILHSRLYRDSLQPKTKRFSEISQGILQIGYISTYGYSMPQKYSATILALIQIGHIPVLPEK